MNIEKTLQKIMVGAQLKNIEYAKSGDIILRLLGKNNFNFSITLTKDDGD